MYTRDFLVEWGDCDPAGIVFYPRFFAWFDSAFHGMSIAAGVSQRHLITEHEVVTPLIDATADFRSPATYGDRLTIAASVTEWLERRFCITYSLTTADRLICSGRETRAWARRKPDGGIKGEPIAPFFRQALSGVT